MRSGGYYGAVYATYWTGETGRAIQQQGGADATLLGLYLLSNVHANMIGLYELPTAHIARETPIGAAEIVRALDVLHVTEFADYDPASTVVWVRTMAAVRLGLTPEHPTLLAGDRRIVMVNRQYAGVVENPFLEPFYVRNRDALQLNRLRCPQIDPQQLGLPALTDQQVTGTDQQVTGTPVEKRSDRRGPRPARPRGLLPRRAVQLEFPSFGIYSILAREAVIKAIANDPRATVSAIADHFKRMCATRHVSYIADVASRAIAAAIAQRSR